MPLPRPRPTPRPIEPALTCDLRLRSTDPARADVDVPDAGRLLRAAPDRVEDRPDEDRADEDRPDRERDSERTVPAVAERADCPVRRAVDRRPVDCCPVPARDARVPVLALEAMTTA